MIIDIGEKHTVSDVYVYDLQTKWPFKLSTQFAATSAVFSRAVIFLHLHVSVVIYEEDNEYF